LVFGKVKDKKIVHILFTSLGKRYLNTSGGYTRILKYSVRKGDGAKIAFIELVNRL
jgi:large subunit ribosomal protein L17